MKLEGQRVKATLCQKEALLSSAATAGGGGTEWRRGRSEGE